MLRGCATESGGNAVACVQLHLLMPSIGDAYRRAPQRGWFGSCVLPAPFLLVSEPGPAWIMPVAGTFMRGRHVPWPARGRRHRQVEDRSPNGKPSPATRSAGAFPHHGCRLRNCSTTHPRTRSRAAGARLNCTALSRIARPQPGGERERICAGVPRIARRRRPSASPRGFPFGAARPARFIDRAKGGAIGCRPLMLPGLHDSPGDRQGARDRHVSDRRRAIPDGAPASCCGGMAPGGPWAGRRR